MGTGSPTKATMMMLLANWLPPLLLLLPHVALGSKVTILVIMDGFKQEYMSSDFDIPNVKNLSSAGVWVPAVQPVFPSSFAPNLASMATGAFPEEHDVIDDAEVFDHDLQRVVTREEMEFWAKAKSLGTIWVRFLFLLSQSFQCIEPIEEAAIQTLARTFRPWTLAL